MWQHFWSKSSILSQVWKASILGWGEAFLFYTKLVKPLKEIEVEISIFLGYSVLY